MVHTVQKKLKQRKAQVKSKEEERHIVLAILPFIPRITERLKRPLKTIKSKIETSFEKPLKNVV